MQSAVARSPSRADTREPVTSSARAEGDPLGASPRLRMLMLGAPLLYFVVTGALNLLGAENDAFIAYLGVVLVATVMFAPLALMPGIGPLHVLVFPALWWFFNLVLRQSKTVVYGLSEHVALPGVTPTELNVLYAKLQLLTAAAQLSFIAGYFLLKRTAVPTFRLRPATFLRTKVVLVLLASGAVLLVYDRVMGGLEGMLLMRGMSRGVRDELRGGGHFNVLLSVPVALTYVLYSVWPNARKSPLFWVCLAFALASAFLVSGSRSMLFYPLIVLTMIHYLSECRLPKLPLLAAAVGAWLAIGAIGIFRTQHFGAKSVDWGLFSDYGVSDYANVSSEALVVRATQRYGSLPALYYVPEDSPLLLGSTYMRILLAPLPQALLPFDKPTAAGRLNGQMFFSIDAGVPCGAVIEAYWNFHVPGVIILFFLLGLMSSYAQRLYLANRWVPGAAAFYVLYVFFFKFESDGAIQYLQAAATAFILLVFLCGFPRLRSFAVSESAVRPPNDRAPD
ncbi:MAG: oligosaccharide repeat unit polymerase [Myxococcota bacterium]|nr:oligosaccharide repeat unit polymerase [Myxococcota bacterium]